MIEYEENSNKNINEYFKYKSNIKLSKREKEVLCLVAQGENNPRISKMLNISLPTVKSDISNIFIKLKVNDRTQAVVKAIKYNIINIP